MTAQTRKSPTLYRGVVTTKSGEKTIRVTMSYIAKHPKYGKHLKRRTVAHVHDENNEANVGDKVQICKCRKFSKTKNWRLVSILESV